MARIRTPDRDFTRVIEDSRRWADFVHRPNDIFISTPPKSGTTWMQGIVSSLLWPNGDAPGTRGERSPWIDVRFRPIDNVLTHLDAQTHRRFIKTHSPANCVPIFEECIYIVVYRDGRDAVMSWSNHRAKMRPEFIDLLNTQAAADGLEPIAREIVGDMDALFDEWAVDQSSVAHLASWWPLRHEPFAHFVHYNDLTADLEGEMRRLAERLQIDVPEALWPDVVDRCRLDSMRADTASNEGIDMAFEGGADSFFYKGTNGRWRDVLTPTQLDRYDELVAAGLPGDAAEWLEHGSLALGRRP
jgi:aryl sulfotransferase